jgi:hypothetical protein
MANIELKNGDSVFHRDAKNSLVSGEPTVVFLSGSTLDWYKLTETSRHVISQSITGSIQEQMQELEKENPDQAKIQQLKDLTHTLSELNRDPKVFKSKEKMLQIIEYYG